MLLDSRDIIRCLQREGWRLMRVKSSHHQFQHPDRPGRVTVAHPKRNIPLKTALSIHAAAGWKKD